MRTATLMGSLALATDLAAGFPPETALRTSLVAGRIARLAGHSTDEVRDASWAGLLRYLGCTGYAHEEARIAGGDDLAFLQAYADADFGDPADVLSKTLSRLARGQGFAARASAIARFLGDPKGGGRVATAHCDQAVGLARRLGFRDAVTVALAQMYERWDGRGEPGALAGEVQHRCARVLQLAQTVEVFARLGGAAAAAVEVRRRRGRHFEPALVDLFLEQRSVVLEGFEEPSVWDRFLDNEPAPHDTLEPARTTDTALAFAHFVDLKSPFTLGHSTGVARLARGAADAMGCSREDLATIERAGLMHDLGRVTVPNGIWDKPAALNLAERERVRLHAYHTERVLAQCPPLRALAELAGCAHERLDGEGYPRRVAGAHVPRLARVLQAADVCSAMAEERAYRPAHAKVAVAKAMAEEVSAGRLDRDAVRAVLEVAGLRAPALRTEHPAGLSDREVEVLCLVARGKTNREVGAALHVSPRTVQTHLEHVFAKCGVSTRAAAALFAVEHDLLRRVAER